MRLQTLCDFVQCCGTHDVGRECKSCGHGWPWQLNSLGRYEGHVDIVRRFCSCSRPRRELNAYGFFESPSSMSVTTSGQAGTGPTNLKFSFPLRTAYFLDRGRLVNAKHNPPLPLAISLSQSPTTTAIPPNPKPSPSLLWHCHRKNSLSYLSRTSAGTTQFNK